MLKPKLWYTIYKLAEIGAYGGTAAVSTTELAVLIGSSQQTASRHLIELERRGLIERHVSVRGMRIRITARGMEELTQVYQALRSIIDGALPAITLMGKVFTGLGEGAYYMSQRGYVRQFVKRLGFDPYPGTLNLRLTSPTNFLVKRDLGAYPGITIEGFEDGRRTFGPVRCYPALINGEVKGAAVIIARTSYDDSVLELIAPVRLREALGLKEGDMVQVEVFTNVKRDH